MSGSSPREPRHARLAKGSPPDGGVTLIEVMAAMGIMSVVMAMITTSVLVLLRTDRSVMALTDAQAAVGRAFLRLDREVRYAAD